MIEISKKRRRKHVVYIQLWEGLLALHSIIIVGVIILFQVKYNDKVFEVTMNVSQYAPEELELKVIENKLIVTGKHEETKDEHGTVASEFTRQFLIPEVNMYMD